MKSSRILKIIFIAIVGVVIINYILLVTRKNNPTSKFFPTPTLLPVIYNKQVYSDANQHLTIQYPQDWNKQQDSGSISNFAFTENNKTFTFNIIPPVGNTIPDMVTLGADSANSSIVYYGGKAFTQIVYLSHGNPIYIFASPKDQDFSFYNFSMQLPPTNTQKYMQIFNQILTGMQIKSNFDPNEILNPSPQNTNQ